MKIQHALLALALGLASGAAMAGHHEAAKGEGHDCSPRKQHAMTAEQHKAKMEAHFAELDADNDGAISRAEFDTAHAQRAGHQAHRGADGAHRGRMLRGMMKGGMHAMHGRMFEMADLNKDGRVSLQEAQDSAVRHFDMADTNKDGRITREERIQRHRQVRIERRPG